MAAINDTLDSYSIEWTQKHSCGVVIASEGYPESYESNHYSYSWKINVRD